MSKILRIFKNCVNGASNPPASLRGSSDAPSIMTEPNSREAIRLKIISSLPPAKAYKMTFRIDWDPLAFVKEQEYREEPDEAIPIAITLTGSAKYAQALTCTQYLCQTWPPAGEHTIRLVKDVLRSGPEHRHTCKFPGLKWS